MGMGYAGGFNVVIEEKDVERIAPKEFGIYIKAFDAFNDVGGDQEIFARSEMFTDKPDIDDGNTEQREAYKALKAAWDTLRARFKEETKIELLLAYHEQEEEGDRYDDVDGMYYVLEFSDCFPESKAFKALQKRAKNWIGIRHFVIFG